MRGFEIGLTIQCFSFRNFTIRKGNWFWSPKNKDVIESVIAVKVRDSSVETRIVRLARNDNLNNDETLLSLRGAIAMWQSCF